MSISEVIENLRVSMDRFEDGGELDFLDGVDCIPELGTHEYSILLRSADYVIDIYGTCRFGRVQTANIRFMLAREWHLYVPTREDEGTLIRFAKGFSCI